MFFELFKMSIIAVSISVLVYVAWVDCRTMEIPDWCHLILFGLGCLQIVCGETMALESRGVGLIAISLPMFLANLLRQDSFGGGDIKLCGAVGFLLGAQQVIAGSLIALTLAGAYGGITLILGLKKPKDSFPLGPFLSIGFIVTILGELHNYEI
jgi:prepilin signal peptidase PulO-like enzyme (type II secretory pathway)